MSEESEIDWSSTTWEGSRRAQIKDWATLSLLQKFKAVEELEAMGLEILKGKHARGEPYIDPDTGQLVPGRKASTETQQVAEPPAPFNPSPSID